MKGRRTIRAWAVIFWLFLHAPLTILERHGHDRKDFPEPPSDALLGVDATIYEGWLDLKVRNDTPIRTSLDFRSVKRRFARACTATSAQARTSA